MFNIGDDYDSLKVGQEICYHIGNLGSARVDVDGSFKLTGAAYKLNRIANELYDRSTAIYGTGEFALVQRRVGFNCYAYLAQRLSLTRTRRLINID